VTLSDSDLFLNLLLLFFSFEVASCGYMASSEPEFEELEEVEEGDANKVEDLILDENATLGDLLVSKLGTFEPCFGGGLFGSGQPTPNSLYQRTNSQIASKGYTNMKRYIIML